MREMIMRAVSFMTFEPQLQITQINAEFTETLLRLQPESQHLSTVATRQRLIAKYWYNHVIRHYASILLPSLIYTAANSIYLNEPFGYFFVSIFIAGILGYVLMYLFLYRPQYVSIYLPRLETVKETFERKQLDQVEKCRQAQLSNLALTFVIYVFDKTSGMNSLQCNDQTAARLTSLFGVDQGSLKKNLELIYGKKKDLPPRKLTEITNRLEEAATFFESINFPNGAAVLRDWKKKYPFN
ncbi:MAG: hypothetical protein HYU71_05105 [Bacteroidetes bacterium]|nr:hypothetical protein [Bacteroidota bacterium]